MHVPVRAFLAMSIAAGLALQPGIALVEHELPTGDLARSSRLANSGTFAATIRYIRADSPEAARAAFEAAGRNTPAGVRTVEYGPCELTPHDIHLRKSSNYTTLGPKPETDCKNVVVTSIQHATTLRYEWFAWWLEAGPTVTRRAVRTRNYVTEDIEVRCRGFARTIWSGSTTGTVVYRGHKFYAVAIYKPVELKCGA